MLPNFSAVLGWAGLGGAPGGIFSGFETILLVIQVLVFPVYVGMQLFQLLLPMIIVSVYEFPSVPTAREFFVAFFTSKVYWTQYVASIPWYFWVVQGTRFVRFKEEIKIERSVTYFHVGYWSLVMIAVWNLTFRLTKKHFDLFDPLVSYLWLVQRVFAGKIWGFYSALLYVPTRWSFHHGVIGTHIQ